MKFLSATPKRTTSLVYSCPMCGHPYTLGVDGTVDGCDVCLKVVRNAIDNTILDINDEIDVVLEAVQ